MHATPIRRAIVSWAPCVAVSILHSLSLTRIASNWFPLTIKREIEEENYLIAIDNVPIYSRFAFYLRNFISIFSVTFPCICFQSEIFLSFDNLEK